MSRPASLARGIFGRAWPIRWQIGALLLVAQLLAHGITALFINAVLRDDLRGPVAAAVDIVSPLTTIIRVIDQLAPDRAQEVIDAALAADRRFSIVPAVQGLPPNEIAGASRVILEAARHGLPERWASRLVISPEPEGGNRGGPPSIEGVRVGVELAPQHWLTFAPSPDGIWRTPPPLVLLMTSLLIAFPLAAVAIWAGAALVAPLGRLAAATERFSGDLDTTPIPEIGSSEMRTAARSFNAMRGRIKTFVEGRARMLAAVSHDLRTPLTRLRLRLEELSDSALKERLFADIRMMEAMINGALQHLRDHRAPTSYAAVDLAALIQTLCDDFADQGSAVAYLGPDRLVVQCDPGLIRRALTNIVANGVNYAGDVRVSLEMLGAARVLVRIEDHGPGIASEDRERVFEPFRRGDDARMQAGTTGFGLGLAIAKDLIERHQGTIELAENTPCGLVVLVTLPVVQARSAPAGAQHRASAA